MAAAAAALAAQHNLAEKQYQTALSTVPKLSESTFDTVDAALKRVAFKCLWADWILDPAIQKPALRNLTDKEDADERNAYMIITEKSQGHQVAYSMESVALGDAKAAYAAFFQHFHRSTAAGRHEATRNFYNATMANTNTNITEWLALVPRRGNSLRWSAAARTNRPSFSSSEWSPT